MRTVKLVISFDGTRYEGWQSQLKGKTLQEVFEKVLLKIFKKRTPIVSSSRTDSGVHALGLAAHFKISSSLPDTKIKAALNFHLPRDIVVLSAKTVSDSFHARFSAKSKLYCYSIWRSRTRPLFQAPYVLWYPRPLKLSAMKKAARYFLGRHDFSALRDRSGDEERSPIRTIQAIKIQNKNELITIGVRGDGFLRHMVRILVGTLLEVGRGKIKPEVVRGILRSKDRKKAGPTIKSQGLTLVKVKY